MQTKWRTLRVIVSVRTAGPTHTEKELTRAVNQALCNKADLYSLYPRVTLGREDGMKATVAGYGHSQANAARHGPSKLTRLAKRADLLARDLGRLNGDLAKREE